MTTTLKSCKYCKTRETIRKNKNYKTLESCGFRETFRDLADFFLKKQNIHMRCNSFFLPEFQYVLRHCMLFTEWQKRRRQSAAGSGDRHCPSNKAMTAEMAMAMTMAIPSAIAMAMATGKKNHKQPEQ